MPELPEVETVRKSLEKIYLNKKIIDVEVLLPRMILSPLDEFKTLVKGASFTSFGRKGKYLLLNLSNHYTIVSHLRMEGKYLLRNQDEKIISHTRVVFYLDDNTKMCYDDSRSFGIMILCKSDEVASLKELKKLGPEPFEITSGEYLYQIYQKKNHEIKSCLLDQEIMCGLGNIYCDEVLYKAKINPYRKANTLSLEECNHILAYAKETLEHALALGGSTISSYHPEKGIDGKFQNELVAYGKENMPCTRCGTIMRKDKLKGRGTTYCPKCQKVCISLGVTGKIASGKSSVIKYFQTQGYPCFSCDDEVTRLYQKIEVKKELINIFGEQVLNDNLTISKTYIKEIISNDLDKKKALEKYIHPLVKELINKFILSHKEDKIALIEVPLMFETHFNVLFDYIVGITCSYTNQIHHLLERGTKSLNNDLVIAQSNKFDQNISKCDFLINNDGSIQELHFSLDNLISKLSK